MTENKNPRALMIGAHPDDCEFKTSGTTIKMVEKGFIIKYVSLTNGETGHFNKGGGEVALIRKDEAKAVGKLAGIEYDVFDIKSNGITADIATRERVICLIREFKPDMIFTHRPNDYHPDHRTVSTLVQDSSYAIQVPNVCPLTPCLRYSPVIFYMYDGFTKPNPFIPDVVIDIDSAIKTKTDILNCHKSQVYEWLPWIDGYEVPENDADRLKWLHNRLTERDGKVADTYRKMLVNKYGEKGNEIKCAEAFEVCEYSRRPADNEIEWLFPF